MVMDLSEKEQELYSRHLSIRLFRFLDGTLGIGIYPSFSHGTVWRWDNGFWHKPVVIHWRAPHCENDTCGSPCKHKEEV